MTITVYGKVCAVDGTAAHFGDYGRLLEAHSYTSFKRDLGRRIPVDLDHDPAHTVGEVVHAELAEDGSLHAVAVCDRDADVIAELEHPVYYSGEFLSSGNWGGIAWKGHDAELLSLALTYCPAMLGQRPVTILPGDARSSYDRGRFPGHDGRNPILTRAANTVDCRRRGDPLQVLDRRPTPKPKLVAPLPMPSAAGSIVTARPALEMRSAGVGDVRHSQRTIELIAIPHEELAVVEHHGRMITEVFSRGALAGQELRVDKIRVNRDHAVERTIGRVRHLDPWNEAGAIATLQIAKTPLGDESLALAAENCLDASVGFGILAGGEVWENNRSRRRITKAFLGHLALTPDPAYPSARVIAVRGR